MKKKLQALVQKWKRKQRNFELAALRERQLGECGDALAAQRYEGEAIAIRWCYEDLELLIDNRLARPHTVT